MVSVVLVCWVLPQTPRVSVQGEDLCVVKQPVEYRGGHHFIPEHALDLCGLQQPHEAVHPFEVDDMAAVNGGEPEANGKEVLPTQGGPKNSRFSLQSIELQSERFATSLFPMPVTLPNPKSLSRFSNGIWAALKFLRRPCSAV